MHQTDELISHLQTRTWIHRALRAPGCVPPVRGCSRSLPIHPLIPGDEMPNVPPSRISLLLSHFSLLGKFLFSSSPLSPLHTPPPPSQQMLWKKLRLCRESREETRSFAADCYFPLQVKKNKQLSAVWARAVSPHRVFSFSSFFTVLLHGTGSSVLSPCALFS